MEEKHISLSKQSVNPGLDSTVATFLDQIVSAYVFICILWHMLMVIVPFIHWVDPTVLGNLSEWLWYAGILILVADLLLSRKIRRAPGILPLYALLSASVLSSFLQRKYGLHSNVKTIVWMLIIFSLFYTMAFRLHRLSLRKYLKMLFIPANLIWSGACVLSLYQFVNLIGAAGPHYAPSPIFNSMGFYNHRLYGLFGYPEYGAVIGLVVIFSGCYYFAKTCHNYMKVFIIFLELPVFWYIVLSGSRNAAVAMYLSVFVCAVLKFRGVLYKRNPDTAKHSLIQSFLAGIIALVILHIMYMTTIQVAQHIPDYFNNKTKTETSLSISLKKEMSFQNDSAQKEYVPSPYAACILNPVYNLAKEKRNGFSQNKELPRIKQVDNSKDSDNGLLNRKDSEKDISTGRFTLWKDYFSLTKEIGLFGLSPENSSLYIQEHHEDLFIARVIKSHYPERYQAGYVLHPHNGYLKVFVSTGFLGLAILLLFMSICLKSIFSYLKRHQQMSPEFLFSLLITLAGASSAMFDLEIFFVIKPMTFIFWFSLGLLMKVCRQKYPEF